MSILDAPSLSTTQAHTGARQKLLSPKSKPASLVGTRRREAKTHKVGNRSMVTRVAAAATAAGTTEDLKVKEDPTAGAADVHEPTNKRAPQFWDWKKSPLLKYGIGRRERVQACPERWCNNTVVKDTPQRRDLFKSGTAGPAVLACPDGTSLIPQEKSEGKPSSPIQGSSHTTAGGHDDPGSGRRDPNDGSQRGGEYSGGTPPLNAAANGLQRGQGTPFVPPLVLHIQREPTVLDGGRQPAEACVNDTQPGPGNTPSPPHTMRELPAHQGVTHPLNNLDRDRQQQSPTQDQPEPVTQQEMGMNLIPPEPPPLPLPPPRNMRHDPGLYPGPDNRTPGSGKKITKASVKLAALNMSGMGNLSLWHIDNKWFHLWQEIRTNKVGVMIVGEAHLNDECHRDIENLFGRSLKVEFTPDPTAPTSRAGLAFVLNKTLMKTDNIVTRTVIPGRAMILEVEWHGKDPLSILGVYAPNAPHQNAQFWRDIKEWFQNHPRTEGLKLLSQLLSMACRPNIRAEDYNPQAAWAEFKRRIIRMARTRAKIVIPKATRDIKEAEAQLKKILGDQSMSEEERRLSGAVLTQKLTRLYISRHKKARIDARIRNRLEVEVISKYWSMINKPRKPRDTIHRLKKPESQRIRQDVNTTKTQFDAYSAELHEK
ncbi:hypothetical protein DFH08DRAFT_800947 [Mycena albidolilacea]|uniref:Uncharacterized protein n=1 Tax=Mycena albidolilacea TaxID=1033008 RepID=A0AAD7EZP9_9AGAR|nr:hypothetical protein DFH08DRAFT_800947 [Mycena albidolilacea]